MSFELSLSHLNYVPFQKVMSWGSIKSYISLNKWKPMFSVISGQIYACLEVSIS